MRRRRCEFQCVIACISVSVIFCMLSGCFLTEGGILNCSCLKKMFRASKVAYRDGWRLILCAVCVSI
jgi:hypothetical protein